MPSLSSAAGFRIGEQGAAAMGRANAVTASIYDISAIYFNPAALTSLKGNSISLGATMIAPTTTYTSPNKLAARKENQLFNLPNFYIGSYWEEKKLAYGFGFYVPFGLGSKWSDTGPFRYEATYTDLKVLNFNPSVAYRLNPYISIGAGINYEKIFVTYNKQNPWTIFGGIADGKTDITGDGSGLGYNLGVQFSPTEKIKIGIAYRSRVNIEIRGSVKISDISGSAPLSAFGSSDYISDVSLPLNLPDTLSIGLSYQLFDRFIMEFDLDWTGWTSYKNLQFNYTDEKPPFLTDTTIQKKWKNVLAFRTGFEYSFNENIKARGGYAFDPNPVPEDTFEPRITDSNRHQLAIGTGFIFGKFVVDIAYMALFFENRTISNNDIGSPLTNVNGTYKSFSHLTGANISYLF